MTAAPRAVAAGARALLLEFDSPGEVTAWRSAVLRALAEAGLPAPDEVVPGACTLLLDGVDPDRVHELLGEVITQGEPAGSGGPVLDVPVVYDGADLDELAELWGVPAAEVAARHAATEFEVAFCGFAPGFAYLLGLDADVPRRSSPRPRVPAGSVALAGRYCGIYPTESPGGWQLVGRTSAQLFDPDREPPALLSPGTRVRFVAVDELDRSPAAPVPSRPTAGRSLTVVEVRGLCTVQDRGRFGYAHLGVPRAGVLDHPAAELANRLVGNPVEAAVIETTVGGLSVRASAAMTAAVTGADGPLTLAGRPADRGVALALGNGDLLEIGPAASGVRAYLAVAGGVAVEPVLGSRSRDVLSGLGPEPLADGAVVPVGEPRGTPSGTHFTAPAPQPDPVLLRVRSGPRADWFGEPGLAALVRTAWTVSPTSNRIGIRLSGNPVPRRSGELESEGIVLGSVQVPPDGQPVVLLADHPTTGGYPVIGVVEPHDLAPLAQAGPGTSVQFRVVKE